VAMLTNWTQGRGSRDDLTLLDELTDALRLTSICGLGQVVPAPIASVLKHFREEVESHLLHSRCPAGVCPGGQTARAESPLQLRHA
jgi:NADH:ubiquinone oxidoreductase subunit F (NADH-binding)